MTRIAPAVAVGIAVLAIAPSAAQAAGKPAVSTGLAGSLTPQSATVTGTVNPNGVRANYRFQFGLTAKYGGTTAAQSAGAGTTNVAAVTGILGLESDRVYHYRIVASNGKGTVRGADRTLRTPKQPLGFALAATPNPLPFGGSTTIAGTLGGTGSANREVQLQQSPWPFQAGFLPVGNPQLTTATGGFAFPVLSLGLNTQYRVVTSGKTPTLSPVVPANVLVDVSAKVGTKRVTRGARLRFSGKIHPAKDGVQIGVQRLAGSKWKTVKGSRTRKGGRTFSTFATRARISKGGRYRVFVRIADGSLQSNASSSLVIRTRR